MSDARLLIVLYRNYEGIRKNAALCLSEDSLLKFETPKGFITIDDSFDECMTDPIAIAFLDNMECEFLLEDYMDDNKKDDFHSAIKNFINLDKSVLYDVSEYAFKYYQDSAKHSAFEYETFPKIKKPIDVWKLVKFGFEPIVSRRDIDNTIYISLGCNCAWKKEHGLQLVFKNGSFINKLGGYDGHLTNSDAYDNEDLEYVIYK